MSRFGHVGEPDNHGTTLSSSTNQPPEDGCCRWCRMDDMPLQPMMSAWLCTFCADLLTHRAQLHGPQPAPWLPDPIRRTRNRGFL